MKATIDIEQIRDTGVTEYLQLISGGDKIVLKATTGHRAIAGATRLFSRYINEDFESQDFDVVGYHKPETRVEVYKITLAGSFRDMFESFGLYLHELCLTQDQIIEFVETHPEWVRERVPRPFFLYKNGDEYLVAETCFRDDTFSVFRWTLEWAFSGDGNFDPFGIVVPQVTYGCC